MAKGKNLRTACPRTSHALWKVPEGRGDPVRLVLQADAGRLPELLPLRHGRMAVSPFTFYRGSALNMAADLATTPTTGLRVQCGGDSHLANFGCFATPERQIIFAVNDLDETLPGPWEWDLKRLAASFVVACRNNGLSESMAKDAVLTCARSYREHMAEFSELDALELWYSTIDSEMLMSTISDAGLRRRAIKRMDKERTRNVAADLFPQTMHAEGKAPVIVDQPPTIFHQKGHRPGEFHPIIKEAFATYRASLLPSTQSLLDRYVFRDAAIKVVGVGSVGTACWVLLMTDGDGNALVLQVKEARASVLEAYAGRSEFSNHGRRIVSGHRLMQPTSDIFLGWTQSKTGRHFYVRQLRDVKIKFAIETFGRMEMRLFADWCGHALALSHARSGQPATISGYLGKNDTFDQALAAFSVAYADQNELDYAKFKRASQSGKVKAISEAAK